MAHVDLVLLFLLVAVAALTWLAHALNVPYPILLVVGGSVIGFVPGVPTVVLQPDLVLLIVLPPLLFHAAYFASLRELRADARAISLNASALVLVTMSAVAVVMHAVVPGLPWAAAFAFGAILSPTDPLAAITIGQRLGVPRRLIVLIEGESLINDGTALVAYRAALAAVASGSFSLLDATGDFVINVVGGIAVGVVAARILLLDVPPDRRRRPPWHHRLPDRRLRRLRPGRGDRRLRPPTSLTRSAARSASPCSSRCSRERRCSTPNAHAASAKAPSRMGRCRR